MVHNKTRVWPHFYLVQQYKVSAELKPSLPSVHQPFWSRFALWELPLSASKHMAACSFSIWNHHLTAKISQCSSSEACLAMQFPLLNAKRKKGWGKKMIISQIYVSYISMATMCSLATAQVHPGTLLTASTLNQQPVNSAGNLSGTLRVSHRN